MSGWRVDLSQPQPHLWSTPESPIGFHLIQAIWFTRAAEEWEISEEKKRRMEYALRHLDCTVALFFRLAFLPFFFFLSDAAVPQSCGCNSVTVLPPASPCSTTTITTTFILFLSLHLYLSPPSVRRAPAPSPRVCRGVSEWWSFSGPCERSCGFSVPHIRGRALALCMLQEFGLAEHQALTTSSPALAAAKRRPDKLPEPHSQMYMKLCRCLTVYIYIH